MVVLLKVPLLHLSFEPSFEPFLNTNGGFLTMKFIAKKNVQKTAAPDS